MEEPSAFGRESLTQAAMIWPTMALVALVFAVWITLFVQRFRHMQANPPSNRDFATGAAAMRYFEPVEMPANNLRNLFEMPVLYFALVPLLLVTGQTGPVLVVLAWIYVALRAAPQLHPYRPEEGPAALPRLSRLQYRPRGNVESALPSRWPEVRS